jgi:hypothetical protein
MGGVARCTTPSPRASAERVAWSLIGRPFATPSAPGNDTTREREIDGRP